MSGVEYLFIILAARTQSSCTQRCNIATQSCWLRLQQVFRLHAAMPSSTTRVAQNISRPGHKTTPRRQKHNA